MNGRDLYWRQTLWDFPKHLYAERLKAQQGSHNDSSNNDEQTYRFIFKKYLAENQYRECAESDCECSRIRLIQVDEEMFTAFPEAAFASLETKQLWQLGTRKIESHSSFESSHHSFRYEVDDRSSLDEPRNESDDRDHQRRKCGQRGETC